MQTDVFGNPLVTINSEQLSVVQERYTTGALRLELRDQYGALWTVASHNVPAVPLVEPYVFIRLEGQEMVLPTLVAANVVEDTGRRIDQGETHHHSALCKLLVPVTVDPVGRRTVAQARHDMRERFIALFGPDCDILGLEGFN